MVDPGRVKQKQYQPGSGMEERGVLAQLLKLIRRLDFKMCFRNPILSR